MSVFLLVRHASHDLLNRKIAGRMPNVSINSKGVEEAEVLARRLLRYPLSAIYSSPSERALQTAGPTGMAVGLEVEIEEAFDEIDFGDWTGLSFEELEGVKEWDLFNTVRSCTRIPGGETMLEAQARAVAGLERLSQRHPGQAVAVFSHGDIVKSALLYFLGIPLDLFNRFEISPASISVLELTEYGPKVLCVNSTLPAEQAERP